MWNVVALDDSRVVASGFCGDLNTNDPVVWTSENGLAWERLIERPPGTSFEAVAQDQTPDHLLMAVNRPDGPSVWRGDPTDTMAVASLPVRGNSIIKDVAWSGDRYLAVGSARLSDFGSRAVAWVGSADGTTWQEIGVPPEADFFDEVEPGVTPGSFTTAGGNRRRGAIYWELDSSNTWSPEHEGIAELIDARHAFWGGGVSERDGSEWMTTSVDVHTRLDVTSAARLPDGWIVAGWPTPKSHPFMIFIAHDSGGWSEIPRLHGDDPAILDMTVFRGALLGVGDAVYAGPDHVRSY